MVLVRMDAAIREQAAEVKLASATARVLDALQQNWIRVQIAFLNHQVDLGDVHINNAPGADVQVSDFTVPHLPRRQPDIASAGMNQGVGKFFQQTIVIRLACQRDSVGFGWGRVSPSIENDEYQRSIVHKRKILKKAVSTQQSAGSLLQI